MATLRVGDVQITRVEESYGLGKYSRWLWVGAVPRFARTSVALAFILGAMPALVASGASAACSVCKETRVLKRHSREVLAIVVDRAGRAGPA